MNENSILDRCPPGSAVMVDKGFTVSDTELHRWGIKMIGPSFFNKHGRASKEKVLHTKKVANACIYVENAIGQLRYFHILNHRMPLTLATWLNKLCMPVHF